MSDQKNNAINESSQNLIELDGQEDSPPIQDPLYEEIEKVKREQKTEPLYFKLSIFKLQTGLFDGTSFSFTTCFAVFASVIMYGLIAMMAANQYWSYGNLKNVWSSEPIPLNATLAPEFIGNLIDPENDERFGLNVFVMLTAMDALPCSQTHLLASFDNMYFEDASDYINRPWKSLEFNCTQETSKSVQMHMLIPAEYQRSIFDHWTSLKGNQLTLFNVFFTGNVKPKEFMSIEINCVYTNKFVNKRNSTDPFMDQIEFFSDAQIGHDFTPMQFYFTPDQHMITKPKSILEQLNPTFQQKYFRYLDLIKYKSVKDSQFGGADVGTWPGYEGRSEFFTILLQPSQGDRGSYSVSEIEFHQIFSILTDVGGWYGSVGGIFVLVLSPLMFQWFKVQEVNKIRAETKFQIFDNLTLTKLFMYRMSFNSVFHLFDNVNDLKVEIQRLKRQNELLMDRLQALEDKAK